MKTRTQIKTIADGIYAEAQKNVAELAETKAVDVKALETEDVSTKVKSVAKIIYAVESQIIAPRVDGIGLPAHITNVDVTDDGSEATISVRSKLKGEFKYKKVVTIAVDADIIKSSADAIVNALYEMFYIQMALENVNALNEKVAGICAENEIPYTFSFGLEPNSNALVLDINDSTVVFNASVSAALEIAKLPIFAEGDEYSDLVARESVEALVKSLKATQTTPQLIKAKVGLIEKVTDVTTKKRASKLLRQTYHRKAVNLKNVVKGVGYFEETVQIGGEDVDIFALVEKTEDGLSVILKPFDVKTNLVVDYDVLNAIA